MINATKTTITTATKDAARELFPSPPTPPPPLPSSMPRPPPQNQKRKKHSSLLDLLVERRLAVRGEARAGQRDDGGLGELGHVGELGLDLCA